MFELTLKELVARRRRMLSTVLAVLLGVSLMVGTLVFTDTITATFDNVLADARAGTDAMVRAPSDVDLAYGQVGDRIDAGIADAVAAVDGVEATALQLTGYAQLVDRDGDAVGDLEQAPSFGFNWVDVSALNPFRLSEGRAPAHDGEIVIDRASAGKGDFSIGDVVTVLTQQEPAQFTLTGIATFGTADSPAGATAVLFTDADAQRYLSSPGQIDGVAVTAADGVSPAELVERLSAVVPDLDVVSGDTLVAEDQAAFHESFGPFRVFMLVFAFVAVFVGAFMINNTFSITVAQRTQQLAMMRSLGASRRQVLRSVMTEAAAIGTLGAGLGLAVGIGLAAGLRVLFTAAGFDLPDSAMVIAPGSMLVSAFVGIAITMLSAWMPARRAGRVAPIAAMRELAVDRTSTSRRRAVTGTLITAGGVVSLLAGLGGAGIELVGLGAIVSLLGVAVLGPVLARPVIGGFGWLIGRLGITGDMAVRNARRNPKRTARTTSSLMVGVALVAFIAVVAASVKDSFGGSLEETFTGTHIVDSGAWDGLGGISADLARAMDADPRVSVVSEARVTPAEVDGSSTTLMGFTASTIGAIFDLGEVTGDLTALGPDGLAVDAETAAERGWSIGTGVPITLPTGDHTFVVRAVYDNAGEWLGGQFVDIATFEEYRLSPLDYRIYASGDDAAVREMAVDFPSATVLDKAEYLDMTTGQLDTMLGVIYALLALAVLIALLGIANSMALSIHERTRELGLLRAVGMTRRQIRSVVRWESVMIALFGTVLGLTVGSFFGWATIRALESEGIEHFTYPVSNLVIVTTIACIAGAVAAIGPARRAARLDVLDALVTV